MSIPERVIEAVRRLVRALERHGFRIQEVYLFGSYARGDWLRTSDVDVVIVSDDFASIPYLRRLDIVEEAQFEEDLDVHIEAIPLTRSELEEKLRQSVVLRDASKYWIKIV